MRLPGRAPIPASLSLALALAGGVARADDPDAIARALFDDAERLMAAGGYDAACPKLAQVLKLKPGLIGTMMELGRCYEKQGKLVSAWSRYRAAADAATLAHDPRAAGAEAKAAALAPKLPMLSVTVAAANRTTPGFSVQRDGVEVAPAEWDTLLPIDPGTHTVSSRAPGMKAWTASVEVIAGAAPLTIQVPVLEAEAAQASVAPPPAAPPPVTLPVAPPVTPPPAPAPSSLRKTLGFVGIGVGGTGLLVGAIAGGVAFGQHSILADVCHDGTCTNQQSALDSYHLAANTSTAGFVAGGVLAATGVVLVLTTLKVQPPQTVSIAPMVGAGFAGVAGRF